MTDRELLEKAAKAAGIKIVGPVEKFIAQFDDRHKGGFIVRNDRGGDSCWNPLTDDGDALRLAVKLQIGFGWDEFGAEAVYGEGDAEVEEDVSDPYAATRRAIVRAAAAMGEQ